jgi:hypothetical protein
MTVSIDPTWPVTNAGPLDVMIECPADDEPVNCTCIAEAEPGTEAPSAAWTSAPASKTIAATATVLGTMRQSNERVLFMSVSFPEFEFGSPDDGRIICSGFPSDGVPTFGSPTAYIASRRSFFEVVPATCRHARKGLIELLRGSQVTSGHCQ